MTGIACLAAMLLLGFLAAQISSLLALPAALLAAAAAYLALGNAAALHVFAPHTAPNAPAEPGTFTALCRQIVSQPHVSPWPAGASLFPSLDTACACHHDQRARQRNFSDVRRTRQRLRARQSCMPGSAFVTLPQEEASLRA